MKIELTKDAVTVHGSDDLTMVPGAREVLRVSAAGEVSARSDDGDMVPITLAPHRVEALRKAPGGLAKTIEVLCAELAERQIAGRRP